MPRYFFDIHDGVHFRDREGVALKGDGEIEVVVARVLGDIVRDKRLGTFRKPLTISVRDETDQQVYEATLTMQMTWKGRKDN